MIKGVLELNVIKYRNAPSAQRYPFLRKQVLKDNGEFQNVLWTWSIFLYRPFQAWKNTYKAKKQGYFKYILINYNGLAWSDPDSDSPIQKIFKIQGLTPLVFIYG